MRFRVKYQEVFTAPVQHLELIAQNLLQAHQQTLKLEIYVLSIKPIIRVNHREKP